MMQVQQVVLVLLIAVVGALIVSVALNKEELRDLRRQLNEIELAAINDRQTISRLESQTLYMEDRLQAMSQAHK
jgi:hypothetical protein